MISIFVRIHFIFLFKTKDRDSDCRHQTITNGQMHAPGGTTFGKTATISCNNGYTLSGSAVVTCLSSGSWDGRASCVPIGR